MRWAFPFLPLLHEDPPDVQRRGRLIKLKQWRRRFIPH